ncbi:MAG: GNAT family N-acetyltransferase [Candidatus Margulisbacteria bacterium]|nr:GNAT family N-acetyltransferase [Candidatus Margulisiibacteriota bacterium]MBU1617116.1 GNAT family N-acetyltransferase [Candidatus Margulisiibacteriota bacterium]
MNNNFAPAVFLTGELVYLRTPDIEKDVISGKWYTWFNDKATTKYLGQGIYPNTIEKQVDFVNSLKNDKTKILLSIIDKASDSHVGVISFNDIDFVNRKASISIVVGEKKYAPGVPLEAMALMIEHGFDRLNLNKIWAGQVVDLWKWVNQLELIGFRIEGYNESSFIRDGKIQDTVWTGVTADRFYEIKGKRGGKLCPDSIGELMKKRSKEDKAAKIKKYIDSLYEQQPC